MDSERANGIAKEIQEVSNGTEISPYLWRIIKRPEIYRALVDLVANGEEVLADKHIETSYKHSIDVATIAEAFADEFKDSFNQEKKDTFVTAALLHDIGKRKVNPEILLKNGKPTDEERKEIERHVYEGWEICQNIADKIRELNPERAELMSGVIAEIVFRHQAHGNGHSYPAPEAFHRHQDPETEELISEMSKKISVIDIFDALNSYRAYRVPADKPEIERLLKTKFPEEDEWINFLINNFIDDQEG
ncbi:MAG: HD domain-containing protein [Patescibacteria group bacterium]|jgi:putative nucleotidyltransferase with HDIG domain|nr:HD domain-containing protein [Patescibacteria group bacterium]